MSYAPSALHEYDQYFLNRFPQISQFHISDYQSIAASLDYALNVEAKKGKFNAKNTLAFKIYQLLEFYQYNVISSAVFHYLLSTYAECGK